ncbi:MAG: hypothetical protein EXR98_20870 [Gemmataceae bacterium]|nr:hypothetical protein [Gemmataceae bacterium]
MDDELTPEQRFAAEDAETLVPRALLLGRKPEDVVADLVKLDWSRAAAESLVARVIEEMRQFRVSTESRKRLIDGDFKQFIGGMLFFPVGVGIALLGGLNIWLLVAGGLVSAGRGWAQHLERPIKTRKNDDAT